MTRRLLGSLALLAASSLFAQDAVPPPPPVPQAVKALESLRTQPNAGPTSWTNGPYEYDSGGNIKAIGPEAYVYDKIGRLKSSTLRGPDLSTMQTQSFDYDAYGNLISTSKLGQTVPLPITGATNRLSSLDYDASGNVIAAGTRHYDYDAAGMPNAVRLGTNTRPRIIYAYTADDERLFAFDVSTGTTHWTLRGLDSKILRDFKQNGSAWTVERDYIYRDGLLLAALEAGGAVEHYSLDHLGTPRLVTDGAGHRVGYRVYWPFGEEWSSGTAQDSSPLKFTGHERDVDPAGGTAPLDYMHARYYGSAWGRFVSVDAVLNIDRATRSPQGWNRYSYVMNGPLRYTDPDGRDLYDYIEGIGNGYSSSLLYNANRVAPRNGDYAVGQAVGDVVALGQTIREIGAGLRLTGASGLVTALTGGSSSPVSIPAAAGGVLLTAHGTTSVPVAMKNLVSLASQVNGLEKQVQKHEQKLQDYKNNPDARDNKGFLKNASPEQRQKIIEARIKSLQGQIENFKKQIREILEREGQPK